MVKIVAVIRRKEGLSREQFLHHWQAEHPPLVKALPGIRGYRQNVAIVHRTSWFADGVAELWFDDVKSVAIAFDSTEAAPMLAHEDEFIGSLEWLIADEHDVDLERS